MENYEKLEEIRDDLYWAMDTNSSYYVASALNKLGVYISMAKHKEMRIEQENEELLKKLQKAESTIMLLELECDEYEEDAKNARESCAELLNAKTERDSLVKKNTQLEEALAEMTRFAKFLNSKCDAHKDIDSLKDKNFKLQQQLNCANERVRYWQNRFVEASHRPQTYVSYSHPDW